MLTLHVEAETHLDLIQKTFKVLGIGVGSAPAKPAVGDPPAPPQAAETAPAPSASSVASEPAASSQEAPKRGRPRKVSPPAEAVTAPTIAPVSAPQAEVGNTVSAPAVPSPAVEGALGAGPEVAAQAQTPSPVTVLTGAEVKEVLRVMSQRFKDWNAGASKAMEIVKVYGIDRLKDLDKLDQVSLRAVVAAANEVKGDA